MNDYKKKQQELRLERQLRALKHFHNGGYPIRGNVKTASELPAYLIKRQLTENFRRKKRIF